MRKIKGLVEIAPQAVTTAVKSFVQVAYVCATWIVLRNTWARDMRGATCIMRKCVSACYMCHICGWFVWTLAWSRGSQLG